MASVSNGSKSKYDVIVIGGGHNGLAVVQAVAQGNVRSWNAVPTGKGITSAVRLER
jgi:hypothetical protein